MADRDDGKGQQQFQRIIVQAQRDMQAARSMYWQSRAAGQVNYEDQQNLHAALLQYFDALRRYRNENIIREEWKEHGIDEIEKRAFEVHFSESKGSGRGASTSSVAEPDLFSPKEAIMMSYRLDDLAKELGFAAPVRMQEAELDEAVV